MSKFNNWLLKGLVTIQDKREEGQGLAEYGLILALIAVVCIGAVTLLGTNIQTKLNSLAVAI